MTDDEYLTGGGRAGAYRRGDVVVRPASPWSPPVVALLRHLEAVGFRGSPRVVEAKEGSGEEILEFVEGDVDGQRQWSDEGIAELGRMLRHLHDATAGFVPAPDAPWQEAWWVRCRLPGAIIGHGDPAPWNIVASDGRPVAFIDWEFAGPVDRMHEIAHAAWLNAQLHDDDVAELQSLPSIEARCRQLRLFLDGYGLDGAEREEFVDRLIEVAVLSAANEAIQADVVPTTEAGPLWGLAWRTRGAAWMIRHRRQLEAAVKSGPTAGDKSPTTAN
jgi:tRNA A-37 threonylcarbamoyl transferase component Bud32